MSEPPELDLGALLEQAMTVQQQLLAAQEQASHEVVEGTAGGGLVRISMSGTGEVTAVRIAPDAVEPDDVTLLEDLVLAAIHDAAAKVRERQATTLQGIGGLAGLPGLPGFSPPDEA